MEPQPSPYDITDLPRFALEIDALCWWILLLLVGVGGLLIFFHRRRLRPKRSRFEIFQLVRKELERISSKSVSRQELGNASLLLKRLLSYHLNSDFTSMSPHELEKSKATLSSSAARSIVENLLEIDSKRYQARCELDPQSFAALKSALTEFERQTLASQSAGKE